MGPMKDFTDDQARTLEVVNVVASVCSLVGSVFIISCFLKFKGLRTFAFKLVFFVSVCDFFYAIGNLLGDAGGNAGTHFGANDTLCTIQALLISYFGLASMLWSASIAFTLHMAFLRQDPRFGAESINTHSQLYHVVCWTVPAFLTLLPLTTDSYGDTAGWCWIPTADTAGAVWRFFQFYIWLWCAVVYNCYVFVHIYWKIKETSADALGDEGTVTRNNKMAKRMKFYPLVLVICHFWGTITTFYEAVTGGDLVLWLNVLQVLSASSMGLVNALVYGLTPDVTALVRLVIFCRSPPTNADGMI